MSTITEDEDGKSSEIIINLTPNPQTCHQKSCDCGSSLAKVKSLVTDILKEDKRRNGLKLEKVTRLIVLGQWEVREEKTEALTTKAMVSIRDSTHMA